MPRPRPRLPGRSVPTRSAARPRGPALCSKHQGGAPLSLTWGASVPGSSSPSTTEHVLETVDVGARRAAEPNGSWPSRFVVKLSSSERQQIVYGTADSPTAITCTVSRERWKASCRHFQHFPVRTGLPAPSWGGGPSRGTTLWSWDRVPGAIPGASPLAQGIPALLGSCGVRKARACPPTALPSPPTHCPV